jgi:outer membrane protein, heavy metal efflux system
MTPGTRGVTTTLGLALLCACAHVPPPAPLAAADTAHDFAARQLIVPGLPPAAQGWGRTQWLEAALALNPQLAQERAEVDAVVAGERTAAEYPNPSVQLFGEYLTAAAHSAAWLYGVSMDFLLREPGARARARQAAALESALARSDVSESIWQVRAALRLALLDAVSARDESVLLGQLVDARQALLNSDRKRLALGDLARAQVLTDELELARVEARQREVQSRTADARARLAAAVGVPATALQGIPLEWSEWSQVPQLQNADADQWRSDALIGRPQVVHALRAYDLAEIALRGEVAKRWPQLHVTPAYAWGGGGLRDVDALNSPIDSEAALGVSFELPIFNQHQGPIGEAVARRHLAGEQLRAVQAEIFGQIDRAEAGWPQARQAWVDTRHLAELATRQENAEQRAVAVGESERGSVLAARIDTTEAELTALRAAYEAQLAFGALEDAYRRPLDGAEPLPALDLPARS